MPNVTKLYCFLIKILILIRKQYYIFRGAPIWMRPIFYFREKDP